VRSIGRRVAALEATYRAPEDGWDWSRPCHSLILDEGETLGDAAGKYGRDKITKGDRIILIRLVSPKFDADGRMVPQNNNSGRIGPLTYEQWEEILCEP
jgi:hypothetical protein